MGCGHQGSVKVISYSFSPNVSPHIPCPQHVPVSRVGLLILRDQTIIARPLYLFIHQLCLCLRLCGCVRSWGPSPFPHPSLSNSLCFSLLPTNRLSADVARGRSGPWPLGPSVCMCVVRPSSPCGAVIGGICVCLCLPVLLDAGGNRMREDQL